MLYIGSSGLWFITKVKQSDACTTFNEKIIYKYNFFLMQSDLSKY